MEKFLSVLPYSEICCIALHILQTLKWFWVFLFRQSFGQCSANHNVTCSPSLAEKYFRLGKNIKGNPDGVWIFWQRKKADIALFLQVTRIRKSIFVRNRTIAKQRSLRNETYPPIMNRKLWRFQHMQANMCFLRGPLWWLTELKNPKITAKHTAWYNQFQCKQWSIRYPCKIPQKLVLKSDRFALSFLVSRGLFIYPSIQRAGGK